MSVEQRIKEAASKNGELLSILSETDYAHPALDQQNRYIGDLENEVRRLAGEVNTLTKNREKELKDHEKYRDSVMKRFAYKMTRKSDKFEAKASKEEQEYFDALQSEHRAKEARQSTQADLEKAKQHKAELESVASRHRQAQSDLDALYDNIFEGPTPGFPNEDAQEQVAHRALDTYHTTRTQSETESQVLEILARAVQHMNSAVRSMDDARSHSRMDMFGGGTITDMMERNALHQAEKSCMEAQMLITQAQRLSPHVKDIPRPSIAQGNIMRDVFFDNIFTDMDFHEKIKASQAEVENAAKLVDQQGKEAKQRHEQLQSQLQQQGRNLEDARVALQKAREQAFEQVAGNGTVTNGPPPSY